MLSVDSSMAGYQVACPTCQGIVTVPAFDAPVPPPPPPVDDAVSLNCPLCMGLFQVLASSQGQQVSCPHCAGLVQVPVFSDPTGGAPTAPFGGVPESTFAPPEPVWAPQPLFPSAPSPVPSPPAPLPTFAPSPPSYAPVPNVPTPASGGMRPIPVSESAGAGRGAMAPNRPIAVSEASTGGLVFNPQPSATARPTKAEPVALLPTEDGQVVALRDPVKTIGRPGQEVELRQLSPEEKTKRRITRNIIMVAASLLLLTIVMFVLMRI